MNELNTIYKGMLLSWGAAIKTDGRIIYQVTKPDGTVEEVPMRIDNMDLYLPLSEVLEGNCVDKVFFHPSCENILSKETEVFKLIRRIAAMKLMTVFREIPVILSAVAHTTKEKKSWKQDILNMLEPIRVSKKTTLVELGRLFARMHIELEEDGLDNRFVHFKVSKPGSRSKLDASLRVYYKTKPTFPFYNEIVKRLAHSEGLPDNQTVEINNHSFSRGCLKLAQHIFAVVIPSVLSPDESEYDSTSPIAARLVSFLGCYGMLADEINRIIATFRQDFNKAGIYPIEVDWLERMEEFPEVYNQVPTLDYNSHNIHEEVADNNFGRSDMGGFLSVSRQPKQHQPQQSGAQQGNSVTGNHVQTSVGDFDISPPVMEAGDRYVRYEIDYNTNRILHHAVSRGNNPVVYECTRYGNPLRRVETQLNGFNGMMGGMMPGMMPGVVPAVGVGMSGMVTLPNGMMGTPMGNGFFMLPTGQMVQAQQAPSTASSFQSNATGGGGSLVDFSLY